MCFSCNKDQRLCNSHVLCSFQLEGKSILKQEDTTTVRRSKTQQTQNMFCFFIIRLLVFSLRYRRLFFWSETWVSSRSTRTSIALNPSCDTKLLNRWPHARKQTCDKFCLLPCYTTSNCVFPAYSVCTLWCAAALVASTIQSTYIPIIQSIMTDFNKPSLSCLRRVKSSQYLRYL